MVYPAVSAAASFDPDVGEAWQRIVRGAAKACAASPKRWRIAASCETSLALVGESGWSVEAYKAWLYVTLARQLLTDDQATRTRTRIRCARGFRSSPPEQDCLFGDPQ
jgi:hypothetical protein